MMDIALTDPQNESTLTGLMLYKPEQVAAMTGLSVFTIRRLAKQGLIPHKRIDRNAMRFSAADITAMHDYFTAQAVAATQPEKADWDDSPFNFTSRGKAIVRNMERSVWNTQGRH